MVDTNWSSDFVAQSASKLKEVEKKLSNEQREYLNQYYSIKKTPNPNELQLICIEWNINEFSFFLDLEAWFFGRWMAERDHEQRLRLARKVAA